MSQNNLTYELKEPMITIEKFKYYITHMNNMILNINKIKILNEFAKDYHSRIYGREIAKKLKMNQKTVSNVLNELEKEHILRYKVEGKNKYYYLNEFYPYLKEVIKLIEIQKKIDFLENYKKLNEIFSKLEEKTEGILVIFGSYADFTATKNSDLDVFVIGQIKEAEDLEDLYKIKINIVKLNNKTKFDKNNHLIKEIIKNHIILKGTGGFIELLW